MNVLYQVGTNGKRREIKGDITYEEAKKRLDEGGKINECAKLCGMSVSGFKKRINIDEGRPANEWRKSQLSLVPDNKIMKKFHRVSLDEKAKMARELGISYGKLSAMVKLGVISI